MNVICPGCQFKKNDEKKTYQNDIAFLTDKEITCLDCGKKKEEGVSGLYFMTDCSSEDIAIEQDAE